MAMELPCFPAPALRASFIIALQLSKHGAIDINHFELVPPPFDAETTRSNSSAFLQIGLAVWLLLEGWRRHQSLAELCKGGHVVNNPRHDALIQRLVQPGSSSANVPRSIAPTPSARRTFRRKVWPQEFALREAQLPPSPHDLLHVLHVSCLFVAFFLVFIYLKLKSVRKKRRRSRCGRKVEEEEEEEEEDDAALSLLLLVLFLQGAEQAMGRAPFEWTLRLLRCAGGSQRRSNLWYCMLA